MTTPDQPTSAAETPDWPKEPLEQLKLALENRSRVDRGTNFIGAAEQHEAQLEAVKQLELHSRRLRAEVEELRKDKERLNWLLAGGHVPVEDEDAVRIAALYYAVTREAIDAARAAQGGGA